MNSVSLRILFFCLSLFTAISAFAQEGAVATVMYGVDAQGYKHKVRAFAYKNEWNRPEVRLEAADVPRIAPGVNQVLGYGRDFDDDGKIETWFMWHSDYGFVRYTLKGSHAHGYDMVQNQLFKQYKTTALVQANIFASAIVSYLSIAAARVVKSQLNYFKEMLNFEEISVRLWRGQGMRMEKLSPEQSRKMGLLLHEGYRRAKDVLDRANNQEFLALLVADVALWMSGGIVVKYIGKGIKFASGLFFATSAGLAVKNMMAGLLRKSMGFIANSMTFVQKAAGAVFTLAQMNAAKGITAMGLKDAIGKIGKGLILRGAIATKVRAILAATKKKVGTRWMFTAASLAGSMMNDIRAESIRHEDPSRLVQTVTQSHKMQKQIVQCLAGNQPNGTKVSYTVKGIVRLEKKVMNVMSENGYVDMAFDIGTRFAMDNARQTADNLAINYVDNVVTEFRQPALVVVGYLVIMGNEMTNGSVKRKLNQTPVLCPITAD